MQLKGAQRPRGVHGVGESRRGEGGAARDLRKGSQEAAAAEHKQGAAVRPTAAAVRGPCGLRKAAMPLLQRAYSCCCGLLRRAPAQQGILKALPPAGAGRGCEGRKPQEAAIGPHKAAQARCLLLPLLPGSCAGGDCGSSCLGLAAQHDADGRRLAARRSGPTRSLLRFGLPWLAAAHCLGPARCRSSRSLGHGRQFHGHFLLLLSAPLRLFARAGLQSLRPLLLLCLLGRCSLGLWLGPGRWLSLGLRHWLRLGLSLAMGHWLGLGPGLGLGLGHWLGLGLGHWLGLGLGHWLGLGLSLGLGHWLELGLGPGLGRGSLRFLPWLEDLPILNRCRGHRSRSRDGHGRLSGGSGGRRGSGAGLPGLLSGGRGRLLGRVVGRCRLLGRRIVGDRPGGRRLLGHLVGGRRGGGAPRPLVVAAHARPLLGGSLLAATRRLIRLFGGLLPLPPQREPHLRDVELAAARPRRREQAPASTAAGRGFPARPPCQRLQVPF
mmetsp:Transcript_39620/g.112353  ORF Transcript_39620/g.112353 Transcript_39620/m.112353 type:complete len:493 (-) Transcript_39620:1818-3296(-)